MSIKDLISNRRGEVASLILIVSMVVATLGVITGSQVVQERIKTATKAQTPFSCSILLPAGQMYTGKSYTLSSNISNGSGSYSYNWRVVQASNMNVEYGATGPTTNVSVLWSAPNDLSLGTLGTARLDVRDLATGQTATCQTILQITTPPPPLTCSVSTSSLPQLAGQTYTFTASVQNGSGTYQYIWKTVQGANNNITYGSLAQSNTHTPTNQWTAPTDSSLGTIGLVRLEVFDYVKATTATCQTVLQVSFPAPTATPTNTPVPPTATNTPVPPTATPSISDISCTALSGSMSGSILNLNLTVTNGLNPFYYQIQRDGTKITQGSSTNASSATIAIVNPVAGTYTAYVLNTQNGFYKTSNACKYTYVPNTNTPIPPPATNTPTTTPAPVSKADLLIENATASFNIANNLTVTSIIKNAGNAAVNFVGTHSIQVDIMKSGTTTSECTSVNTVDIAGLTPNAKLTLPLLFPADVYPDCPNFNPVVGTKYTVRLAIDPTNVVNESDESNNTKTVDFTQPTPLIPTVPPTATTAPTQPGGNKPDLIVKTSTYSFNSTNGMTMIAGIQNIGTANVNNGTHLLNVEVKDPATSPTTVLCETTSPIGISNLAPQAIYSHTIFFPNEIYNKCPNFAPIAGKTYKVTLYADIPTKTNPSGTVNESNENNNSRSFNFVQPGGNPIPTATPTTPPFVTETPAPPTATTTQAPVISCRNIVVVPNGTNLDLQILVNNGNNPFYYQIKKGTSVVKRGSSTSSTRANVTLTNPANGTYQAYVANRSLDNFVTSPECQFTHPATTQPPTATPTTPNTTSTPSTSQADMVVTLATVSFTPINAMEIAVKIRNAGNAPVRSNGVDSIGVTIFSGDAAVCSGSVIGGFADMPAGTSRNLTISATSLILNACSSFNPVIGTSYRAVITVDVDNKIAESDENNNTYSTNFVFGQNATATPAPADLPDIKVMSTTHSPYLNAITFDSAVKNIGNRDVNLGGSIHDIYYQLKEGANVKCSAAFARNQVDHMQPGDTVQLRVTIDPNNSEWKCPSGFVFQNGANYSLIISLDHFKRINELDEANNIFTYDFTYNSQGATATPTQPAATPTDTPVPGTPTPTPLRAICQDILINGDSAQKNDVIFLPNGYSDYSQFEADAREAMSHYKNAVPSGLQSKYNYKVFTNLEKGYGVITCDSTTNGLKYPCWSSSLAKEAMRNCNGDGYVILHYTPKPSEDANKAAEALAKFGNVKAITLGKNSGEMLVLRYDISELTKIVSGSIIGDGTQPSLLMQLLERVLQRFR